MTIKKIIFVDDDQLLLEQYQEIFSALNFQVKCAENGIDCGCLIPTFYPDLIVLDLTMPEMGGIKAINILTRGNNRGIYLLVVSGNIHQEEHNLLTKLHIPYFHKPVDFTELVKFVQNIHLSSPPGFQHAG